MCPITPELVLEHCIELACYFITSVSAAVSWIFVGRM
jgi:hypothetical protein